MGKQKNFKSIKSFYRVDGPAIISFSGGRTSGYMLYQILDVYNGKLPNDVYVFFANTGREMPETLDFVQECQKEWNVNIVWLEHEISENPDLPRHYYKIVDYKTASRDGKPFMDFIKNIQLVANPVARACTKFLKMRPIEQHAKKLGLQGFTNVVGLRADEPRRVANVRKSPELARCAERVAPLADSGVTVKDVAQFWKEQPFDLQLENVNGTTPLGNCDLCFLKSTPKIYGIIRDYPHLVDWWIEAENTVPHREKRGKFVPFRQDRPDYKELLRLTQVQGDFFKNAPDQDTISCMCTD